MISRDPIFQKVAGGLAIGLLALACINILRPFFGPLLWAVILTVATWPVFLWILSRVGGRRVLASVLASFLVAVFCLLPVTYGVAVTAQSLRPVSQKLMEFSKEEVPPAPEWLKEYPFGRIVFQQWNNLSNDREKFFRDIDPLIRQIATRLGSAAGRIGVGLLEFSFALIICGFLFHGGESLTRVADTSLRKLFGPEGGELLDLAARTIRSVMLGILGTAALQAGLMGLGFYLAGVPQVILLGFAGFFFASLQLSTAIVWLPVVLWLFAEGRTGWAIFNLIWGIGVVGLVDNFTKPYLISRGTNLPFGIIFMGVIGGFLAYGFLGIFFGSTLMAVAYRLLWEWLDATTIQAPKKIRK